MSSPLVSVAIPCYNHEAYIKECIDSIIAQDYQRIELIIVDDGSTDMSVAKILELESVCNARFERFEFRTRPNVGLCNTLNEAIEWCRGVYFCAIASDDAMLPSKTTIQVDHFENNAECAAVFGGAQIINERGAILKANRVKAGSVNFEDIFLQRKYLLAPTQMIRLNALKGVGGYPENLHIEDWYMWLALLADGYRIDNVAHLLCRYRRHDSNISKNFAKMMAAREEIINIHRDHALFPRAIAHARLSAALDAQTVDKFQSLSLSLAAVRADISIIADQRFLRYVLRMVFPKSAMR